VTASIIEAPVFKPAFSPPVRCSRADPDILKLSVGGGAGVRNTGGRTRTNNPLERLLREIRRRTRVVGAFPDGLAAAQAAPRGWHGLVVRNILDTTKARKALARSWNDVAGDIASLPGRLFHGPDSAIFGDTSVIPASKSGNNHPKATFVT
jgi:hypothetical protein